MSDSTSSDEGARHEEIGAAGDLPEALAKAMESLRADPRDHDAWGRLEDEAATAQRPDEIAAFFLEVLGGELTAEDASDIGQRAASFIQEWFGEDAEELIKVLERVLEIDTTCDWAFQQLTMAYNVAARWDELMNLYDRVIAATEDPELKRSLLDEAANVAKDFAQAPDRAIGYLSQMLELAPTDSILASSLERLLERQERWQELVDLWTSRIEGASAREAAAQRIRISECLLDKLGDPSAALDQVERVLREGDEARAVEHLERIAGWEGAERETKRRALRLLEEHYREAGEAEEVVRVLAAALEHVPEEEKASLHRELGDRLIQLGRHEDAMPQFAALLELEPTAVDAHERLRELAGRTGDSQAFAEALESAARQCDQVDAKVSLLLEAAKTRRVVLDDDEGAIALYRQVLDEEEAKPASVLLACRQLNALLEALGRTEEQLEVLERLATLEPEASVQRDVLGRAARLADSLGQTDRALAIWKRCAEGEEPDVEALSFMVDILKRESRWEELIETLLARAEAPVSRRQSREDLVLVARLREQKLSDVGGAIAAWQDVRERFGADEESTNALADLFALAERWEEYSALLDEAAERESNHIAGVLARLGEVCRDQLGAPDRALGFFRRALRIDPAQPDALDGLRKMLDDEERRGLVADVLAGAYEATENWDRILDLLEHRLDLAPTDAAQARLLRDAAQIQEHQLGKPNDALRSICRALVVTPWDDSLESEILRLGEETGEWDTVVEAYKEAGDESFLDARRQHLLFEAGRLAEEKMMDPEAALESYAAVHVDATDRLDAAVATARAAAASGIWDRAARALIAVSAAQEAIPKEVVGVLESAAEAGDAWAELAGATEEALESFDNIDPDIARAIDKLVAKWREERLEDPIAAEMALRRAADRPGRDEETLRALARLQWAARGRDLHQTLMRLSEVRLAKGDLDPLFEAAKLALEELDDRELAAESLETLYREAARIWRRGDEATGEKAADEAAMWAIERIVDIEYEREEYGKAVNLLVDASQLPIEGPARLDLLRRAGNIAAEKMGDGQRAMVLYRSILADAPDDVETIRAFAKVCRDLELDLELLSLLKRELVLCDEAERRLALRLETAKLIGKFENLGGRLDVLKANLEEQPGHAASIDALVEVHQEGDKFVELLELLEAQASLLERREEIEGAADLWRRVAVIAEQRLGDKARAVSAYRKVQKLAGTVESLDALARLQSESGEHASAARWLERRLAMTEGDARLEVSRKLAMAYLAAGQRAEATARLEAALEEAPQAMQIRSQLADLYRSAEQWEPLATLLTDAAPYVDDIPTLRAYANEAAELFSRLGSPDRAIAVLEKASSRAPDDKGIKRALAEGLVASDRIDEGRVMLEELIESFGRRRNPERADVHFLLAKALQRQGDLDGAMQQLELAAKMDVRNTRVAGMLGQLAVEAGDLARAEKTYRALLMVVRRNPPKDERAMGPAEVLFELYQLAKKRENDEQAQELLRSVLRTASQSAAEARRFRHAMTARGEAALLLEALEMRVEAAAAGEELATALAELGDALAATDDRKQEALDVWFKAIAENPQAWDIHDSTRALARDLERSAEYAGALRDVIERVRREEEAKVASKLLLRLGLVLEEDLEDYAGAAKAYSKVEAGGYDVVEARIALARVAGQRGDREEELRLLTALVGDESLAESARTEGRYRLAELQLARRETSAAGLATLEDALDRDAHYEKAGAILREATTAAIEDADRLALYGKVARASGDDDLLLDYLEKRCQQLDATIEEAREAADLLDKREGELDRREAMLTRAIEIAEAAGGLGDALWAPKRLAALLAEKGDLRGAARWLNKAAEAAEDEAVAFDLWVEGAAAATKAGDHAQALDSLEQLLDRDRGNAKVWAPALEAATALGDEERLTNLVQQTISAVLDGSERNAARLYHAKFLLGLDGREQDAAEVLRAMIEEEPEHEEANALLSDLYERIGFDEGLSELLRQQLDAAKDNEDTDAIRELTLKLGELLTKIRREDAMDVYRAGLEWLPDDKELAGRLLSLLGPDDDPRERVELMERPLKNEEGQAAADLAMRLADEWQQLWDDEGVHRVLALGYQIYPEDEALRRRLEDYYRERGEWTKTAELLVSEANRLADASSSVPLFREAATIYRENLEDLNRAMECLAQARAYSPDDLQLLEELVAQRRAQGDERTAVSEVSDVIERCAEDPEKRGRLLLLKAELHGALAEHAAVVEDLEAAYAALGAEVSETLQEGLEALRGACAGQGDSEGERAATLRLVAVLLENSQTDRAREVLSEWLERSPNDKEALYQLLALDEKDERWRAVAETCNRLVELEQGEEQVAIVLRAADAWEKCEEPGGVREALERVHQDQPTVVEVRDRLWALYEAIGAKRELATLLVAEALQNDDEKERFEQLQRAGNLFLESGPEGVEQAIAPLEEACRIKSDDHATVILLVDAYTSTGRYAEAGQLLEQAIAARGSRRSPQLAELQHRMSRLAAVAGDKPLEFQWLSVAFDSDRRNGHIVADLANLAMELGELDAALQALRVVTVSKVESPLSRAQAFLMQAQIAQQKGETRRALMWAHRAHDEDPELLEASELLEQLGG